MVCKKAKTFYVIIFCGALMSLIITNQNDHTCVEINLNCDMTDEKSNWIWIFIEACIVFQIDKLSMYIIQEMIS